MSVRGIVVGGSFGFIIRICFCGSGGPLTVPKWVYAWVTVPWGGGGCRVALFGLRSSSREGDIIVVVWFRVGSLMWSSFCR